MRIRIPPLFLWQLPLYIWSFYLAYHYGGYRWLYPLGYTVLFVAFIWTFNREEQH